MGIHELYIKTHFSAAHFLRGYDGDCARMHGHNWNVEVYIRCSQLNEIGIGVDFKVIKSAVKALIGRLDHQNLNEIPPFIEINPTSENLSVYLYRELKNRIDSENVRISKIKISETDSAGSTYWEED